MSDTTPRPDETPAAVPTDGPTAPPADEQPQYAEPQYGEPQYAEPQYAQQPPPPPPSPQQLPPPAYAGATPGTTVAPPNPMSPSEERTTGLAAHGVALAATVLSGGFLGFVAALVMYLVFRDRGPFVRYHTANALNVQIIVGIVMLVSVPLMFVLIGFVSFAAAWLFAVIVHVIGMVKANNGEWWAPPLTPNFVK